MNYTCLCYSCRNSTLFYSLQGDESVRVRKIIECVGKIEHHKNGFFASDRLCKSFQFIIRILNFRTSTAHVYLYTKPKANRQHISRGHKMVFWWLVIRLANQYIYLRKIGFFGKIL